MSELTLSLPRDLISALDARHNGIRHTPEEVQSTYKLLLDAFNCYNKAKTSLDNLLGTFWEERKVEEHYGSSLWYNAHSRRKRYEKTMRDKYKVMFTLLTHFDGNYNQEFSENFCISPEDIMEDFKRKYLKETENDKK